MGLRVPVVVRDAVDEPELLFETDTDDVEDLVLGADSVAQGVEEGVRVAEALRVTDEEEVLD